MTGITTGCRGNVKMESAASAQFTFDPNPSILHLHELPADGEPKSRSLTHARSRITNLVELIEDSFALFFIDTDPAIGNGDEVQTDSASTIAVTSA